MALMTGGSSGIGRAVAELLAAASARVAVNSADAGEASAVAAGITASGGIAAPAVADVRDHEAITSVVRSVVEAYGSLDTLVTCAGIQRYGTVADTSEAVGTKSSRSTSRVSAPGQASSPARTSGSTAVS